MIDPQFSVPLVDLENGDKELECPIPNHWLEQILEGTDARARGSDGQLEVTLSKSGKQVMVRGRLSAPVEMDCARSLEPIPIDIEADVFLLLSPRPGSLGRGSKALRTLTASSTQKGQISGNSARPAKAASASSARKARQADEDEGELLSEEEAATDYYSGEDVVLDGFIREFILLELPLFPLRSEATPHIAPPPELAESADQSIDPRLAPLAALRDRLRNGLGDKE